MPDLISVIITVGPGMSKYLPESLSSARKQSTSVQVVVVFDREPPVDLAGVVVVRGNWGNVQLARRAGIEAASGTLLLFLDADNQLPRDFCEHARSQLVTASRLDPRVAGVYPAIDYYSADGSQKLGRMEAPDWDWSRLERSYGIDACTLVWKHALQASWHETTTHDRLEDMHMWSQLVRAGWTFIPGRGLNLWYRRRDDSMSAREHSRNYVQRYALETQPVTLFVPLAGRLEMWPRLRDWLRDWPAHCPLVLRDCSNNARFYRAIQADLPRRDGVQLDRQTVLRRGLADEDRYQTERQVNQTVAAIYNRFAQELTTPQALIIEDDILPRQAASRLLENLLGGLDESTIAVSGYYPSRYQPHLTQWTGGTGRNLTFLRTEQLQRSKGDYLPVAGTGFGCLLVRREALREVPLAVTDNEPWYDGRFFRVHAERGARVKIAKSADCEHRCSPGFVAPRTSVES